jgi:outer membrane lipoprotein-sorting protein
MKYLRTVSTRRLLALIAGLVAAIAAGTAIAVAAAGAGPVPPRTSLAKAIHHALGASAPAGITAQITFTNNLISSSDIQGADPLLTGATGRLWARAGHLRVELQSDNGDSQIVYDNGKVWAYDASSNTVYTATLPADHSGAARDHAAKHAAIPSLADIQKQLGDLAKNLTVSGAKPSDFGGAAAYTVKVQPTHDGGLLGAAQVAWDAIHGVPLDFAIYASGDSTPVLELKVTDISFGSVPMSDFPTTPPAGAKVVKVSLPNTTTQKATRLRGALRRRAKLGHKAAAVTGVAAVAAHLKFPLAAPATLNKVPRRAVRLVDFGGSPAALVLYGQGLGGIAVIEHAAAAGRNAGHGGAAAGSGPGGGQGGLSLPTVSINGATGHELDTALGTAVWFTRGGVSYVVVGSVQAIAAEAAARGL